jgi:DNA ligase 1
MKYETLAQTYESLTKASQRLKKTFIIAEFLKTVPKEEIQAVILLLQGRVYPIWDGKKIGIAAKTAVKAIAKAAAISQIRIEELWKNYGDLGIVAENVLKKSARGTLAAFGVVEKESLTVRKVFDSFRKLPQFEGSHSNELKQNTIVEILAKADEIEAKYIIRTVLEDLRVGASDGTLRDAIIWAYFGEELEIVYDHEKNEIQVDREKYNTYSAKVQHAFDMSNDLGKVCEMILKYGYEGLDKITLTLGVPIKMMLAMKALNVADGLSRSGSPAQVEIKYDGFRIQMHKDNDKIILFTRRFEEVTTQFPDVIGYIKKNVFAKQCILDGEIVGYDRKTKKYLPFQKISQRIRRKYNIDEIAKEFPVELNIYDILLHEEQNMLTEPLMKRRTILNKIIEPAEKEITLSESIISGAEKEIQEFYEHALNMGHEGLMIKNRQGVYQPGSRVGTWLKLKPTMDPLELVITGAEWGDGKRAHWFSSFTLSCRNDDNEFVEIGKLGTGIKEKGETGASFEELTKLLEPLIISEKGRTVRLKPKIVIEVAYQEIQKSPTYSSGFALRFPTLLKLRLDKNPEDISEIEYIEDLYFQQKK